MREILCDACRSSLCKKRFRAEGVVPMPPCERDLRKFSLGHIKLARQQLIEKLVKHRALVDREDELRMKLDRTSIDAMRLRKITLAHTRPLSSSTTCLLDKHPPQAGTSAFTANRSASPQSGAYNVPQESKHDVDDTRPRHLSGQHDGAITSNHEGESLLRRKISSVTSPAAVRLRNAQEKAAQRKRSLRMLDEDLFRVQDVLARARRFSQEDLLNDSSDARHPVPGQLAPERSASEDNLSESRSQGVRRAAPEHQNKKERPTSTYY